MASSTSEALTMQVEAFAKVNWSLDITGVRDDGYHLMDMLMQPVSLADEITLTPSEDLSISSGGYPPVRADHANLAYRAAEALKKNTGFSGGASVHVHKRIPVGAGLGGGSADAAGVLLGLNSLWNLHLSLNDLCQIGLSLGADVPFCLHGGLTRPRGIGELMEPIPLHVNYWLVLIQPCRGLNTGEVFKAWSAEKTVLHPDTDNAVLALQSGNLPLFCSSIGNVLQPVSLRLRPEIASAIEALKASGAAQALMTGSGSAVFGIFRSRKSAASSYAVCSRKWRNVFLCHSQSDSIRIQSD